MRHRAEKPFGIGRYASGQKRCQGCDEYIIWDGIFCPCCSYRLRTKPRNLKYKAKLRAGNKIEKEDKILLSMQHMQKSTTARK